METREQLEMERADLRRQRGYAHLHGKKFDDGLITALDQKIDALDDVENAKVEASRTAQVDAHQAAILKVRTELADLSTASNKALAEAEGHLRKAVAAQRLHHQHEASKRKLQAELNRLTGTKDDIASEFELFRRCSRLWLAQLNLLTSAPGQYGPDLRFPSLHLPSPDKSWV